jgi:hypothetical protein
MKYIELPKVTRITIVGENGTLFEQYEAFTEGVEIHLQDGGHTMKVFPLQKDAT